MRVSLHPSSECSPILRVLAPVAGPINKGPFFVPVLSFLFFLLPRLLYFLLISCTILSHLLTHASDNAFSTIYTQTRTNKQPFLLCVYGCIFDSLNEPLILCRWEVSVPAKALPDGHNRSYSVLKSWLVDGYFYSQWYTIVFFPPLLLCVMKSLPSYIFVESSHFPWCIPPTPFLSV